MNDVNNDSKVKLDRCSMMKYCMGNKDQDIMVFFKERSKRYNDERWCWWSGGVVGGRGEM